MSQFNNQRTNNIKIFTLNFSDINGRLDPLYYYSVNNLEIVNKTTYPIKKLSQVIDMQRGRFGHRPRNEPKLYGGEYPFIQTGDIVRASQSNGKITYSQTLNELGLKTSRLFDKPVVVITIAANIGDTAILDYPACFPDSLIGMTPKTNELTLQYINLYFKFIKNYLEDLAPQSAQKNINYQQLSPVPIVVPPLEVQHKAVELYEKALHASQQQKQQAQDLLANIDTYLLTELGITLPKQDNSLEKRIFRVSSRELSGGRFDPFFNDIFYINIIKSILNGIFSCEKLKNICYSVSGVVYSRDDESPSGHVILRANNISLEHNEINFDDLRHIKDSIILKSSQRLLKGDILMCSASGSKEHVGKVAFIKSDSNFYFGGFMMVIRPLNKIHNHRYLFEYLQSKLFRFNLLKVLGGTNINNLNFGMLSDFAIPLPPIQKQNQIAEHIQAIRTQAKQLQTQAEQLLANAKAHIEQMILGQ